MRPDWKIRDWAVIGLLTRWSVRWLIWDQNGFGVSRSDLVDYVMCERGCRWSFISRG